MYMVRHKFLNPHDFLPDEDDVDGEDNDQEQYQDVDTLKNNLLVYPH